MAGGKKDGRVQLGWLAGWQAGPKVGGGKERGPILLEV